MAFLDTRPREIQGVSYPVQRRPCVLEALAKNDFCSSSVRLRKPRGIFQRGLTGTVTVIHVNHGNSRRSHAETQLSVGPQIAQNKATPYVCQ